MGFFAKVMVFLQNYSTKKTPHQLLKKLINSDALCKMFANEKTVTPLK
jgi:hypothetical protein